jgi:predicted O-methyltransferase YrrM
MSRYAIRGGKEGKDRLQLLSQVLLPTTSQLLCTAGLSSGMKCLDVGCGGGFVTLLMAHIVGPQGKAVGVDADGEILALAQQDAASAQLANVEFRQTDAATQQEEAEYDLVYARFLLTHLSEPEPCLAAMVHACKPQGALVIEDIDFSGSFCYPPCAAYQRYTELYQQVVLRRGGDANIGPKLPGLLRRAGLAQVQLNVIQPAHITGEGKLIAAITLEKIASSLVAERLATADEIEWIINDLRAAAADTETVMSLPRIFQTWGKRV